MGISNNSEFTAYVGIDWADKKHDACIQAASFSVIESLVCDLIISVFCCISIAKKNMPTRTPMFADRVSH